MKNEAKFITVEQFGQILSLEEIGDYRLIYETIWNTGTKIEEALTIKKEDIDFEHGKLRIRGYHGRYREIDLLADLKWKLHDRCEKLGLKKGYIFTNHRSTIYKNLTKRGHEAGIKENVTPRTLSRTFGKLFLDKGGNMLDLQKIYGHAKTQQTLYFLDMIDYGSSEKIMPQTQDLSKSSDDICEKCGNIIDRGARLPPEKKATVGNLCDRCYQGEQSRARSRKSRQQYLEMLGGKCVKCGFSDWRALQADHVRSDGVVDRRRFKNENTREMLYYLKHPYEAKQNLQLLCANCNAIKKHEQKEWWRRKQRPAIVE